MELIVSLGLSLLRRCTCHCPWLLASSPTLRMSESGAPVTYSVSQVPLHRLPSLGFFLLRYRPFSWLRLQTTDMLTSFTLSLSFILQLHCLAPDSSALVTEATTPLRSPRLPSEITDLSSCSSRFLSLRSHISHCFAVALNTLPAWSRAALLSLVACRFAPRSCARSTCMLPAEDSARRLQRSNHHEPRTSPTLDRTL